MGRNIHADLNALGDSFQLRDGEDRQAFVDHWMRNIEMLPSEFLTDLSSGLPGAASIRRASFADGALSYEFHLHDQGAHLMEAQRMLDFEGGVAYHQGMVVHGRHNQGRGIGAVFVRNGADFYEAHGLDVALVDAGLDNGGYTWARFGFVPDDWEALRRQVRAHLVALTPRLPDDVLEAIEITLADDDPHAAFFLTDDNLVVDGVKVGMLLLNGTQWSGRLEQGDALAYGRFRRYVDGAEVRDARQ